MADRRKKELRRQEQGDVQRPTPPPLFSRKDDSPVLRSQIRSVEWQGPLPPPEILRQYGFIHKGPERLFRLAEQQAKHRRRIESRDSWTEAFQRVFGSISGFLVTAGVAGGALYLMSVGRSIAGFGALLVSLGILVSALQGAKDAPRKDQYTERAEREAERARQMEMSLE